MESVTALPDEFKCTGGRGGARGGGGRRGFGDTHVDCGTGLQDDNEGVRRKEKKMNEEGHRE